MLVLYAKGVTKQFGGLVAVNNFDFEMPEGKIISIIGPNGAGKTTFFNCITGFYTGFDDGTIEFYDNLLNGKSADQITNLGIARTYQNIRLFSNMTAIENILVGRHRHYKTFWAEAIFQTKRMRDEEADALEEAINNRNMPETAGFFFGNDSYDGYDEWYREDDARFLIDARQALKEGKRVFYDSWW